MEEKKAPEGVAAISARYEKCMQITVWTMDTVLELTWRHEYKIVNLVFNAEIIQLGQYKHFTQFRGILSSAVFRLNEEHCSTEAREIGRPDQVMCGVTTIAADTFGCRGNWNHL